VFQTPRKPGFDQESSRETLVLGIPFVEGRPITGNDVPEPGE